MIVRDPLSPVGRLLPIPGVAVGGEPAEPASRVHSELHLLQTAAYQARRILDRALEGIPASALARDMGGELDPVLAVMARARGLLVTLEDTPEVPVMPTLPSDRVRP
jgi:hypothetical protein